MNERQSCHQAQHSSSGSWFLPSYFPDCITTQRYTEQAAASTCCHLIYDIRLDTRFLYNQG